MNTIQDVINKHVDRALKRGHERSPKRDYLGASRLGVECSRALQYEFLNTPKDEGEGFTAALLRTFQAGHVFEELAVNWLRAAGFTLHTHTEGGKQFGFTVLDGKLQGHVDGIITAAPKELGMNFPALWECKSLNNKSWNDTKKKGLVLSKPVYAAQIAMYQAYMSEMFPGLYENPALFTAINKDTSELYHELVPFDAVLAQKCSDRAVNIIRATEANELLPCISETATFYLCRMCSWKRRCWEESK